MHYLFIKTLSDAMAIFEIRYRRFSTFRPKDVQLNITECITCGDMNFKPFEERRSLFIYSNESSVYITQCELFILVVPCGYGSRRVPVCHRVLCSNIDVNIKFSFIP